MGKITGMVTVRGREKMVRLIMDGHPAFTVLAETVLKAGLRNGQELTESDIESLAGNDLIQRCHNAALRYLGHRPRSETEVRQRLLKGGFTGECIERTMEKLRSQGLVDDVAFARFWRENRDSFSPRSRRLTRLELQRKGVKTEVIEDVVNGLDDSHSAYRAAIARVGRLPRGDYAVFRRRLEQLLARKGFDYTTIWETVDRIWQEYGDSSSPDDTGGAGEPAYRGASRGPGKPR